MISCADGRCKVSGPLTIRNAAAVLEESRRLLTGDGLTIDLSEVTEVDSAAVSLLLEWRRAAQHRDHRIAFENLPDNLESLARLYGVNELIVAG